jgi:hypothetical protein
MKFVECGSCGEFHRADYWGDCRNDEERYSLEDLEEMEYPDIEWLEDQIESELI